MASSTPDVKKLVGICSMLQADKVELVTVKERLEAQTAKLSTQVRLLHSKCEALELQQGQWDAEKKRIRDAAMASELTLRKRTSELQRQLDAATAQLATVAQDHSVEMQDKNGEIQYLDSELQAAAAALRQQQTQHAASERELRLQIQQLQDAAVASQVSSHRFQAERDSVTEQLKHAVHAIEALKQQKHAAAESIHNTTHTHARQVAALRIAAVLRLQYERSARRALVAWNSIASAQCAAACMNVVNAAAAADASDVPHAGSTPMEEVASVAARNGVVPPLTPAYCIVTLASLLRRSKLEQDDVTQQLETARARIGQLYANNDGLLSQLSGVEVAYEQAQTRVTAAERHCTINQQKLAALEDSHRRMIEAWSKPQMESLLVHAKLVNRTDSGSGRGASDGLCDPAEAPSNNGDDAAVSEGYADSRGASTSFADTATSSDDHYHSQLVLQCTSQRQRIAQMEGRVQVLQATCDSAEEDAAAAKTIAATLRESENRLAAALSGEEARRLHLQAVVKRVRLIHGKDVDAAIALTPVPLSPAAGASAAELHAAFHTPTSADAHAHPSSYSPDAALARSVTLLQQRLAVAGAELAMCDQRESRLRSERTALQQQVEALMGEGHAHAAAQRQLAGALQAEQATAAVLRAEVESCQSALQAQDARISALAESLASRETALLAAQQGRESALRDVEEVDSECSRVRALLSEETARGAEQLQQLLAALSRVRQLESELSDVQTVDEQVGALKGELALKEKELAQVSDALTAAQSQLAALSSELESTRAEIVTQRDQHADELARHQAQAAASLAQLVALAEQGNETWKKTLTDVEKRHAESLAERQGEVDRVGSSPRIVELQLEIDHMQSQLDRARSLIRQMEAVISSQTQSLASAQQAIVQRDGELARLQAAGAAAAATAAAIASLQVPPPRVNSRDAGSSSGGSHGSGIHHLSNGNGNDGIEDECDGDSVDTEGHPFDESEDVDALGSGALLKTPPKHTETGGVSSSSIFSGSRGGVHAPRQAASSATATNATTGQWSADREAAFSPPIELQDTNGDTTLLRSAMSMSRPRGPLSSIRSVQFQLPQLPQQQLQHQGGASDGQESVHSTAESGNGSWGGETAAQEATIAQQASLISGLRELLESYKNDSAELKTQVAQLALGMEGQADRALALTSALEQMRDINQAAESACAHMDARLEMLQLRTDALLCLLLPALTGAIEPVVEEADLDSRVLHFQLPFVAAYESLCILLHIPTGDDSNLQHPLRLLQLAGQQAQRATSRCLRWTLLRSGQIDPDAPYTEGELVGITELNLQLAAAEKELAVRSGALHMYESRVGGLQQEQQDVLAECLRLTEEVVDKIDKLNAYHDRIRQLEGVALAKNAEITGLVSVIGHYPALANGAAKPFLQTITLESNPNTQSYAQLLAESTSRFHEYRTEAVSDECDSPLAATGDMSGEGDRGGEEEGDGSMNAHSSSSGTATREHTVWGSEYGKPVRGVHSGRQHVESVMQCATTASVQPPLPHDAPALPPGLLERGPVIASLRTARGRRRTGVGGAGLMLSASSSDDDDCAPSGSTHPLAHDNGSGDSGTLEAKELLVSGTSSSHRADERVHTPSNPSSHPLAASVRSGKHHNDDVGAPVAAVTLADLAADELEVYRIPDSTYKGAGRTHGLVTAVQHQRADSAGSDGAFPLQK